MILLDPSDIKEYPVPWGKMGEIKLHQWNILKLFSIIVYRILILQKAILGWNFMSY